MTKNTWQQTLASSEAKRVQGAKAAKAAGALLWTGAQEAVGEWLPNAADDAGAERLYNEAMEALGGAHRKGDASKIKTVAIAVRDKGLTLADFPNLSRAYAEATRLTKTAKENAADDEAAEEAVGSIDAPKTASTAEAAAKILLSKGVDGAVVAILDALGADNSAAHRAFSRAVSEEIGARVTAKTKAEADAKVAEKAKAKAEQAEKAGATKATAKPKATKATPKDGATKAKPKPVSVSKGDPNKKALPPKAKPVQPVNDQPDMFAEIEGDEPEVKVEPVKAKPVRKARPVVVKR